MSDLYDANSRSVGSDFTEIRIAFTIESRSVIILKFARSAICTLIVYFDDALYLFFCNTELCKNQAEFSSLVVH